MSDWEPHSAKQTRAVFTEKPILVCATGVQWGKTAVGAHRMLVAVHKYTDPSDSFLIIAPTFKIMEQSTLKAFKACIEPYASYHAGKDTFQIYGGGTIYLRTGTDPNSMVGITNIRHVWLDEAGLLSLYLWENIQARASTRSATIDITTSPYTLNWLYREIILPKMKDANARPDVELIQATSLENPYVETRVIEQARITMDPRRFNALFGGVWERMSGLVYDCFDEVENQCEPFTIPTAGTRIVGGIDWGYTDPFVFKIRAITAGGFQFGIHEYYKEGHPISEIEDIVLRLCQIYDVGPIYCDPSQPAHIEQLNRAFHKARLKAHCLPANNSIRPGIDRHYELLKTRKLKYFKGLNKQTIGEIDVYHYPRLGDLGPDQKSKDQLPVQQNDHAMDAERYISISISTGDKRSPFTPSETPKQEDIYRRIEQHRRRPKAREEKWS